MNETDVHAFLSELTAEEGRLRNDNASGEYDEDAMWDREGAYMQKYYRRWLIPWVVVSGNPGSAKAKKKAKAHRPFAIYKITPYEHPDLTVWVAAIGLPYEGAPPYGERLAIVLSEGALKVAAIQGRHVECEGIGCPGCDGGWLPWDEGNDKTRWLETLGGPSGPAVRFVDPGPRYAALHERED